MSRLWPALLFFTVIVAILAVCTIAVVAEDPHVPVDKKVTVDDPASIRWGEAVDGLQAGIACGVRRYDFARPDESDAPQIACYARNASGNKIDLTAAFGSYELHLLGQGARHQWASILWSQSRNEPKPYQLAPGEQITVFESPVAPIFEPDGEKFRWDWMARLRPPKSPVTTWANDGYETQASFWFVIRPRPEDPDLVVESQKIIIQFGSEEEHKAPESNPGADIIKEN